MGVAISIRLRLGAQIEDVNVNSIAGLLLFEVLADNLVDGGVGKGGEMGSEARRSGG